MNSYLSKEEAEAFDSFTQRLSVFRLEQMAWEEVAIVECIDESDVEPFEGVEVIRPAPAALDDTPPKVRDPVEKVQVGSEGNPMDC